MTQFMLLNDLRFFCRKAASFNIAIRLTDPIVSVNAYYQQLPPTELETEV